MNHVWKSNGDYELHIPLDDQYSTDVQFPVDDLFPVDGKFPVDEDLPLDDCSAYCSLVRASTHMGILTIKANKFPSHTKGVSTTYDPSVCCAYVSFSRDYKRLKSLRLNNILILDIDTRDNVIGIEVIDVPAPVFAYVRI
jgi:uncharacterized protein YuzE